MIAGIGSTGSLVGIYPQYSTTPVKKVPGLDVRKTDTPIEEKEEKSQQSLYKTGFETKVEEAYANQSKTAVYSKNPYDQLRKNMELNILSGRYIDIVA